MGFSNSPNRLFLTHHSWALALGPEGRRRLGWVKKTPTRPKLTPPSALETVSSQLQLLPFKQDPTSEFLLFARIFSS